MLKSSPNRRKLPSSPKNKSSSKRSFKDENMLLEAETFIYENSPKLYNKINKAIDNLISSEENIPIKSLTPKQLSDKEKNTNFLAMYPSFITDFNNITTQMINDKNFNSRIQYYEDKLLYPDSLEGVQIKNPEKFIKYVKKIIKLISEFHEINKHNRNKRLNRDIRDTFLFGTMLALSAMGLTGFAKFQYTSIFAETRQLINLAGTAQLVGLSGLFFNFYNYFDTPKELDKVVYINTLIENYINQAREAYY